MQVFNTFFKILKKQMGTCIMYIVIFVTLCLLFSKMNYSDNDEYSLSNYDIAVFDNDKTEESEAFLKYMATIHTLHYDYDYDEEELQDLLYNRDLKYVLVIDEGFAENYNISNLKIKGNATGIYVDMQIAQYISTYRTYIATGFSPEEAGEKTMNALDVAEIVTMKEKESKDVNSGYNYFLFYAYIIMAIMFVTLGTIILQLNKRRIVQRISVSPMHSRSRIVQIILASLLFSIVIWGIFMLIAFAMAKGDNTIKENLLLSMNALVFTGVTVSIVSIVTNFDLKIDMLNMISNIVALALSFLGGVFVPLELLSDGVIAVGKFLPTYWYSKCIDKIYIGDFETAYKCMGVICIYALALFAVSVVVNKQRKQNAVE